MKRLWSPLLWFLVLFLGGCASGPGEGPVAVGPEQVDKLYVVDCLLPAQVRRLGMHMTYLAARRPIRTTALDCEIRGGEYVAYDRSNYATALKVWLPMAKEGDPKAQTYVGEIYEKGLGLQPDYRTAARWYRKAAEQGYAPAMINLGFLYEKGFGVPRDPVAALNWYRRASGLDRTDIAFAASVEVYNRRMTELREAVAQSRQEAAGLRRQLASLRQQYRQTRKVLQRYRAQVEAGRREVRRLKRLLKSRPQGGDDQALRRRLQQQLQRLKEKERMVGLLEKELQEQNRELAGLRETRSREVQAREQRIQQLERQLAQRNQELLVLRRRLSASQDRLRRLRRQVNSGDRDLQAQLSRLGTLERQLAEKRAGGEVSQAELKRLTEQLRARQAEVERTRRDIARMRAEMETLSRANRTLAQKLAARERQAADLEARLGRRERVIQAQEGRLQALARQLSQREKAIEDLRRQLQAANAGLQSQRQVLRRLERELAQKQNDSRIGQAELALLASQVQSKQAAIERQQAQIASLKAKLAKLERRPAVALAAVSRDRKGAGDGPWIEIVDPPLRPQRGSLMVVTRGLVEARTVVGKVHAPEGLLAFLVNDEDFIPNPDGSFKFKVPLRGRKTPVHLVAVDRNSRRTELEFVILRETEKAVPVPVTADQDREAEAERLVKVLPRRIFGRYHALLIGNNAYRHLPVLETPVNDVRALARVLRQRYGFETKVLLNATRYDILKALNEYRRILTDKDNLLIYYAGHGTLEKVNQRGFWLPVDAEKDNTANWISNQDVTDLLRIMAAAHIIVIADSCYSGSLTRSSVARLEAGMSPEKKAEWIKLMLKARSRMALTSGGLSPVLDSGGGNHSVFAKALIQALQRNRGIVESFRLYTEVSALVADAARDQDFHQVPEFAPIRHAGHEAGEFFFVPVSGAGSQARL